MSKICTTKENGCFSLEKLRNENVLSLAICIQVLADDLMDRAQEQDEHTDIIKVIVDILLERSKKIFNFLTLPDTERVEQILDILQDRNIAQELKPEAEEKLRAVLISHLRQKINYSLKNILPQENPLTS